MENIFENVYFSKPYRTRDGRKAIFQKAYPSQIDSSKTVYSFFTEDSGFYVNEDGKMDFKIDNDVFSFHECHPECDIISEWHEEISEEELEDIAIDEGHELSRKYGYDNNLEHENIFIDGFKEGYHKAIEK